MPRYQPSSVFIGRAWNHAQGNLCGRLLVVLRRGPRTTQFWASGSVTPGGPLPVREGARFIMPGKVMRLQASSALKGSDTPPHPHFCLSLKGCFHGGVIRAEGDVFSLPTENCTVCVCLVSITGSPKPLGCFLNLLGMLEVSSLNAGRAFSGCGFWSEPVEFKSLGGKCETCRSVESGRCLLSRKEPTGKQGPSV